MAPLVICLSTGDLLIKERKKERGRGLFGFSRGETSKAGTVRLKRHAKFQVLFRD